MTRTIELSDSTFSRLQAFAVPLVDTAESTIIRLLDAYEGKTEPGEGAFDPVRREIREFESDDPPDLTHTKVLAASFAGKALGPSETHWNGLLNTAVRAAAADGRSIEELQRLILVNFTAGRKEDEGYRFLEGAGLSVQGQDANAAWRAVAHIAKRLGVSVNVVFVWRQNERAAHPGVSAQLRISGAGQPYAR
jgi:hypothetical protein